MPGPAVHFLGGLDVLRALEQIPLQAPFPATEVSCRNAFLCGTLGPDMGYCPGADPFLADLAHYVRTAELARNLLRFAQTPTQRAFAWGWVHHILADVLGHPLVNHSAAEQLLGNRELSVSYEEDRQMHLRVELGLDAFWSVRDPRACAQVVQPVWDRVSVTTLSRAYEETYEVPFHPDQLLTAHHASLRAIRWVLFLDRLIGSRWLGRRLRFDEWCFQWLALAPVRFYASSFRSGSLLHAFMTPLPPAEWLVESSGGLFQQLPGLFFHHLETGLEQLEDYNLDLGITTGSAPAYGLTKQTLLRLSHSRERAAESCKFRSEH